MRQENRMRQTLYQQLADFKRQNPKVVEAMELFGITLIQYQRALEALYNPRIYQSTSTVSEEKPYYS